MVEHLEESTDVVKSNKKLIGAVLMCVVLFLAMIVTVGFMPQNTYIFAGIFCLAVIGTTSLLYQIVKKI
jgi:hypothetical protein